jgi:mRNA interferase RelE/StbE
LRALESTIRARVLKAVARYAETGTGDVKHLQGQPGYRLRVSDYRVRFAIVGGEVLIMLVIRVGHRREIYR